MNPTRWFPITAGLLFLSACTRPHFIDHSVVLVRVDGHAITEADYQHYLRARDRIEPPPPGSKGEHAIALREMVNTVILAHQARRLGLQNDPSVHFELMQQRNYILAHALVARYLAQHPVTQAELAAAYRRTYSGRGQVQYRARQILVHSRRTALMLIQDLRHGAHFAVLARRYSLDPDARKSGGQLGWFTASRILPSFVAGVAALKPGEVSPRPLRTEFGWYVVQLEGERMVPPPSFASAEGSLDRRLVHAQLVNLIATLRARAHISRP